MRVTGTSSTARKPLLWAGLLLVALIGLPLAWYLASPLFVNRTVEEAFPAGSSQQAASGGTAQPALLGEGRFNEIDAVHRGEGVAALYRLPDGQQSLRLESFRVTNGPDLYVYLSGHADPRDASQLHGAGDFEVGRLKGNVGSQNYELPADLDLGRFKSVVIYCKQFSVVFSTATLGST